MFDQIGTLTLAALLAVGLVFTPGAAGQTTWYVDDDAPNDPGPGDPGVSDPDEDGSAEHPFDAIQEAINAAVNGDEVVVADGTYTGYGNRDLGFWGKAITVRSENGPDNCVIDCQAGPDDWYWAMYFDNEGSSTLVNGLTITNAYCGPGGGISCYGAGSPTIVNCIITGNETVSYGGGIYCGGGASPTIVNCIISSNEALSYGGGIRCGGTTTIVGCSFLGNAADFGGGAYGRGSATFANCTFSDNVGYSGGGGYFIGGVMARNCTFSANEGTFAGGIICGDSVTISDCVISDNIAYEAAAGLSCGGEATITGCMILGNWVLYDGAGGGIYCGGDDLTITGCVIADNFAAVGAGIYCHDGSPAITGCLLAMNSAVSYGAIQIAYSAPTLSNCLIVGDTSYGSALALGITDADPTIANCTITGHRHGILCSHATATVTNCILWGNTIDSIVLYVGGAATVTYSDIEGGWEGTGNLDVDPLFVDSDGSDDDPNTWEDNDYHFSGNSPCVDAADNDAVPAWVTTDLDGRLRFAERFGTPDTGNGVPPIVDMGAYEYQCTGDLDGDGEINLSDLGALLAHYGTTAGAAYADGDLDQDTDVDLSDLAALLAAYGATCE